MPVAATCWTRTGLPTSPPDIAVPGHFGEWLQGRLGPGGPVVLVTLPRPGAAVHGWHHRGAGPLRLSGAGMTAAAARRALGPLGCDLRGRVRLRAAVPPGQGMGVSTATLVALTKLAGWSGPPAALARACIAAEGASDPLMWPAPGRVLWASRAGQVLDTLPAVPACTVVGGVLGPARPTDPRDTGFADIADLVADWRRARRLATFAELASESAARCVARRGPADDPTPALARALGALGWVAAHTGGARGLIFAPGTVPHDAPGALRAAGLRGICRFRADGCRAPDAAFALRLPARAARHAPRHPLAQGPDG